MLSKTCLVLVSRVKSYYAEAKHEKGVWEWFRLGIELLSLVVLVT